MQSETQNSAVSTTATRRRRMVPWLLLLAALFALLYLIAWLATRYDETESAAAPVTTTDTLPATTVPATTAAPTTVATTVPVTTVPPTTVVETTAAPTTEAPATIGDLARANPESFSTLLAAAEAAGFGPALDAADEITVFAPTDDAFADVDPELLATLVADPDLLNPTIGYHVVEGTWTAADLVELTSITTVSGDELSIEADADGVILGGAARVVGADVSASNGVLHVLDTVLVPQTVSSQLTAQAVTSLLSLEPIQFADSSATITEDSIPTLQEALELLAADPGARLEIAGHTDDVGPAEGNTRLSQRRADAVREWLIANGADAERLVAVGYGEGQPLADNSTEDGRAANRRIEFVAQ